MGNHLNRITVSGVICIMILSFHPCFVGDTNIICAGREPGESDLTAIRQANAVILPQGCKRPLHEMAQRHCVNVFPDYRVRFDCPGKTGQARLFKKTRVDHPTTLGFADVGALTSRYPRWQESPPIDLPFVFKFDWGGEGEAVFFVETRQALTDLVNRTAKPKNTGPSGFLFQKFVPSRNRSLRVAVIGSHTVTYWRVQENPERFHANLADGGRIDTTSDRHLQEKAASVVRSFCSLTGINLAGFDLLFSSETEPPRPLFLEINWFFGRRGLGGSENYYKLLTGEITRWLKTIRLA